ncbi:MAG: ATP-binding protein [Reichenbachiella sp.]|uniref:tetratricopeptide repeat-containing hybrid sensor histidine kinase/response regulator n=1 Tax=Reichenbachiella sp. TaxID=2184521 RepID=UPI0032665CE3
MKKLSAYILIALLCCGYSYAQPKDSLKSYLEETKTDSARVALLAKLGFEYAFIDLDSSRQFSSQAIQLADDINYTHGKADALNSLAISYDIEGNHEIAITYWLEALDLYSSIQAKEGLARIYNNCGMVYQSLGDTTKSLEFHSKSLQIEKELGDSLGIAYSMTQVAALHLQMADYDQALYFYSTAQELLEILNDNQGLAYVHWGLGEMYLYMKEADKALSHSQFAFDYFESEENTKGMSETSLIMGKTYLLQQNTAKAEEKLLLALEISEHLDAKNVILESLINLSSLYKTTAAYAKALDYHERFTALQDTVLKNEMTSNIKEIEAKYNYEKQQQQIELLSQENEFQTTLRNVSIGVTLAITVFLILLYWAYLSKARTMDVLRNKNEEIEKKNAIIEIEKKNALAAAQAKSDFLSLMSHEIRTPMNVVIGSIYLLMEDDPSPEQAENLNMLKFSAENLLTLLNDILDLNKLESGKLELESIPFDMNLLIKGISDGYGVQARSKGIDFSLDVDDDIPKQLIGDPGRLSQILNNLISNGIKFTEEGDVKLRIRMLKKGHKKVKLKFIIEDTGIGIPPDKQEAIFENFTQANSNTTRKYGGSGLGLAITKHVLNLFGSDISLESELGKGSKFSFKLSFKTNHILETSDMS